MGDATTALRGARRPRRPRGGARPGLPRRLARRHRRGRRAARARPRRRRRRRRAAPDRARADEQGYLVRDAPRPARAAARAPSAGSARPRCARCSRSSTPAAAAATTCATPARPASATGASRAWEFGDEQPLDVVRTVRNAVLRGGRRRRPVAACRSRTSRSSRPSGVRRAAVALLVDLSFSMELRGTWGAAKQTALALHSLVTTKYPQDAIEIIGFSDYAQVLRPEQLAGLDAQRVQGTNLQHALVLAGRHLGQAPGRRAGRARRHRRRADRAPDPQTATRSSAGRRCRRRSS